MDGLSKLYRPTSALTWNGNPYQGTEGIRELLKGLPTTKHEVQSFDCHPIPGQSSFSCFVLSNSIPKKAEIICFTQLIGTQPPSLLVTVSGTVIHGKGTAGNPASTPAKSVEGQPRVFAQTFMLVPDPTAPQTKAGEVATYYINADAMRFVG